MDWIQKNPISRFVDIILRGIAEVFLQNNPLTGICILVGVFVSSWVAGLYAIYATVVSTLTAILLGVPKSKLNKGMYGFNGTLTGLALELYMKHDPILVAYVFVASIFVTIVTAFIMDLLRPYKVAILTAPFVLTTWLFIAALYNFGRLGGSSLLGPAKFPTDKALSAAKLTPTDAWMGFLNGVAQVMFQKDIWTGVAILVGLIINSRITWVAAMVGSATGLGVAWALGGAEMPFRAGLFGFNPVLTAVDLAGIYYLISGRTIVFSFAATVVTAIVYGTIATILAPVGLPVLTSAFVLVTWISLLGKKSMSRLHSIDPDEITTAEEHLERALHLPDVKPRRP